MVDNYKITEKIKDKKHSIQFLPKSLLTLSTSDFIIYNNKKLKTAFLIDIIHNLLLRYYFKKENRFNLSSIILKEKYGYIYNYYIDYLIETEKLILVRNYLIGKNTKVYKLNDNIINEQIIRYNNSNKKLLKSYANAVSILDNIDIAKNSILPEVKHKIILDLFSVTIDYTKAMYYLNNTSQDLDTLNKNKYSVDAISTQHIFYHFDDYGRVHTNFTILKSFIRKNCLFIDGEETCETDINNSQPLFLCKIIDDNDCGFVNKEEFKLYKTLTINGNFYQYIMDNSNITDKRECKETIYKILFGLNKNKDTDIIFKNLFPTIYNFILSYKQQYGNYKLLSHALQIAESNFIFNKVIKSLMLINPDIKIITIHDSIVYQSKYKDIVEHMFNSLLSKEFNYQN